MPFEVANVLRRAELAGDVSAETAALAHDDLRQLQVRLVGYEPLADRVWELRERVSAYDASYVALAELLDVPLATLDAKLSRAPRCRVLRSLFPTEGSSRDTPASRRQDWPKASK